MSSLQWIIISSGSLKTHFQQFLWNTLGQQFNWQFSQICTQVGTLPQLPMGVQNPRTIPSGRRTKEKERKNVVNSVHFVLPATHKGSARTSLGPKLNPYIFWELLYSFTLFKLPHHLLYGHLNLKYAVYNVSRSVQPVHYLLHEPVVVAVDLRQGVPLYCLYCSTTKHLAILLCHRTFYNLLISSLESTE